MGDLTPKEAIKEMEENAGLEKKLEDSYFSPEKNPDALVIVKQKDGNFMGYAQKFGKIVRSRQNDALITLQLLLTHDGSDEIKS